MKYIISLILVLILFGCDDKISIKIDNLTKAKMNSACKNHGGAYSFKINTRSDVVTCNDGNMVSWRNVNGNDVLLELQKFNEQDKIEKEKHYYNPYHKQKGE